MSTNPGTKGSDYEHAVSSLISGLGARANLSKFGLGSGRPNRIMGASGYEHQIDVSLQGSTDLFLFEAKCLKRVVGVQEILVLKSRLDDISAAFPSHQVHATIISMKHISKGAKILAEHFKINADCVRDIRNYGISFARHHFIGRGEIVSAKSTMKFREIPPN